MRNSVNSPIIFSSDTKNIVTSIKRKFILLTDIFYAVTRFVQRSRIKLEADDGEYHDGEKN